MSENNILAEEKISKLMLRFAIPSILALLVNSLYNIADQIFIGQGVGYLGNGATNVVFLLTLMSISLSLLLGDGSAAFYSIKLGEDKKEIASKCAGNLFISITTVSLFVFIFISIFLEPILKLFGCTDLIIPLALDYGRIIVFGIPLFMITVSLNSLIRADGSPKFAMASILVGTVLNLILDPIFIFGFHWGVKGAAIATVIGQTVSFFITVFYFKKLKYSQLSKDSFLYDFEILKKTCALGISTFIDQISFALVLVVNNNLIVHFGAKSPFGSEIPLSAFGIAMKVQSVIYSIVLGIGLGMQPVVGFNYGAKNYSRVKEAFFIALTSATAITVLSNVVLVCFSGFIIHLFGSVNNELYYSFSNKFFNIYFLLIAFLGFQTVAGIFFQAIGKAREAAIISFSYQILFRILSATTLCFLIGLDGVLWSGPIAEFLSFLIALFFVLFQLKHFKNIIKSSLN